MGLLHSLFCWHIDWLTELKFERDEIMEWVITAFYNLPMTDKLNMIEFLDRAGFFMILEEPQQVEYNTRHSLCKH